jgi:hypothetical protein
VSGLASLQRTLRRSTSCAIAEIFRPLQVKASIDVNRRGVSVVSRHKGLLVAGPQLHQTPLGIEARFLVTSGSAIIIVSRVGNRLFLKSGIHRAYLLASLGVTRIPCVVVKEKTFSPISSSYPSFSADILAQPRPPLLKDFFDDTLALTATLQRTNKVIRITAEDLIVPVE